MFKQRASLLLPVLLALAACGALGLESPQSFNDRLGYALASQTGALDAATRALENGQITVEDAEALLALADRARELLDSSRRIMDAGQVDEANRRLSLATAVLRELNQYLGSEP